MAERMNIPEQLKDERIDKWKPIFDAATAGIRASDDGGKKGLQMLPIHICRTLAERELVIEVVAEHLETEDVEHPESIDTEPGPPSGSSRGVTKVMQNRLGKRRRARCVFLQTEKRRH